MEAANSWRRTHVRKRKYNLKVEPIRRETAKIEGNDMVTIRKMAKANN